MYKLCNHSLLIHFKIACTLHSEDYSYNTRSSAMLNLPEPRTDEFQFSISFSGPCLLNKLPDQVKLANSLVAVKCLLKEYCMHH